MKNKFLRKMQKSVEKLIFIKNPLLPEIDSNCFFKIDNFTYVMRSEKPYLRVKNKFLRKMEKYVEKLIFIRNDLLPDIDFQMSREHFQHSTYTCFHHFTALYERL